MARPRMEGMTYFPHDTDASNDEKIEALRALYGNDGYAFYFIICERVYRTPEAELDISHPAVLSALINKIGVSREMFENMLQTAFDIGCFDKTAYEERCVLTSNGIKKRANDVKNMRKRWRDSKNKENDTENTEENNMENYEENPEENARGTGESKVNKSKEKENKKNIYTPEFETWYSDYPNPEDKMRTFKNFKKCLKENTLEELIRAKDNYKAKVKTEGREKQYIKTSANFLGRDKFYKDYINVQNKSDPKELSRRITQNSLAKRRGYIEPTPAS